MKMFNKIQSNKNALVGKSVFGFDDENISSQSVSKYGSKTVSENKIKNQFKRIVSMYVSTLS